MTTSSFFRALTLFVVATAAATTAGPQWRCVSADRNLNISGMALLRASGDEVSFIVVHDNKLIDDSIRGKVQPRVGILTATKKGSLQYTNLSWPGTDLADDLEAITVVPNAESFMALTSKGKIYHLRLNQTHTQLEVIKIFSVPTKPGCADCEGFALHLIGESLLAVWAERGEGKDATLFWSKLELKTYKFDPFDPPFSRSGVLHKVDYAISPACVRSISDIKVNPQGSVFISAACDPGDNGPFASAIYDLGKFKDGQQVTFKYEPKALLQFNTRKIEAIEFVSWLKGGLAYGTDDENFGAAIYLDW